MCTALGFYFAIRSAVNQHVVADPALTLPQTDVGVPVTVSAYSVTGPARGVERFIRFLTSQQIANKVIHKICG